MSRRRRHDSARKRAALLGLAAVLFSGVPSQLPAAVTLVGGQIAVSTGGGAYWAAMSFNPTANQFLVLWVNVSDPNGWQLKGRRIDANTGALLGSEFYISNDPPNIGAVIGSATYNSINGEWFVAYQASFNGQQADVLGQRIASDGSKVGGYIPIAVQPNFQNSADVAHDPVNDRYLVTWSSPVISNIPQIHCRLFDSAGNPVASAIQLSEVNDRNKYSNYVVFNPVVNEFMVIWLDYRNWPGSGQDNGYGDIYGQRVSPLTGLKIGSNIPIYAPLGPPYTQNGQDTPNGIVCSPQDGRYMIGVTKLQAGDPGWTTVGMLVNSLGAQVAPVFNLSRPQYGVAATPAYDAVSNSYFISYSTGSSIVGKEVSAAGTPTSGEQTVMPGISIRDSVIDVRPSDGLFMQFATSSTGAAYAQRFTIGADVTPPAPVSNLTATRGTRRITLNWTNPSSPDFTGTMIRFKTTGFPTSITDGTLAADEPGTPNTPDSFTHTGLVSGVTYYYAAFAHDGAPNHATAATATGVAFYLGDFDFDDDVDMQDFSKFQLCLSGDLNLHAPGCEAQDLDGDLDVDSADFGLFQPCLAGAHQTPGC